MNKLLKELEFTENCAISISSENQRSVLLKIFNEYNLKWASGKKYGHDNHKSNFYNPESVLYIPLTGKFLVKEGFQIGNNKDINIITFEDFVQLLRKYKIDNYVLK